MKNGGNKSLIQLLDVYGIDRLKTDKATLYNSRLLDFYRKLVIILHIYYLYIAGCFFRRKNFSFILDFIIFFLIDKKQNKR